jgi:4-hydroxy-tetrahydrodipicolinate synthase
MKQEAIPFRGIIPPIVTPFRPDEELDEEGLRREVAFHLEAGVHGVSVSGSTGEGALLRDEELRRVWTIAKEEVKGRVPFIPGVIRDSTRDAVASGLIARDLGVDGLMVAPVHYAKPTDDGMYEFYATLGRRTGLPIVIYNVVPINPLSPELLCRLVEIKEVVGVKQSGGDIHALAEIIRLVGQEVAVMSAIDDLLLGSFVIGAHGAFAGTCAMLPRQCIELYQVVGKGDLDRARQLHTLMLPLVRATIYGVRNYPSALKEAINMMGRRVGRTRSPLTPLTPPEKDRLRAILKTAGLV